MHFIGIDWASETHVFSVVDEAGKEVGHRSVPHDPQAVADAMGWLRGFEPELRDLPLAIESGALLLAETFLDAGFPVYVINPKQADRFRDRLFPAGSKDDRRDAFVLASALRTDRPHFRLLQPDSDLVVELRVVVAARQDLVRSRTSLTNRLRQTLGRYFPPLLSLYDDLAHPWIAEFLKRYPTPEAARKARPSDLRRLLERHRIRSVTAEGLHEKLHGPSFPAPAPVVRGCQLAVESLLAELAVVQEQMGRLEERIRALIEQHPDSEWLLTLPGVRHLLAARVLAALGDRPDRYADATALRAYAGTSPITRQSGKGRHQVVMRHACNRQAQCAFFLFALTSRRRSRWAAAYYEHARAHGATHARALRALSNKWAKIVWKLRETREAYDEERHTARLIARGVPWARNLGSTKAA